MGSTKCSSIGDEAYKGLGVRGEVATACKETMMRQASLGNPHSGMMSLPTLRVVPAGAKVAVVGHGLLNAGPVYH